MINTSIELVEKVNRDRSYKYLREQIESLRKYLDANDIHKLEDLFITEDGHKPENKGS